MMLTIIPFIEGPKYGDDSWIEALKIIGTELSNKKVRQIFFVHGTFVGNDPLGLLSLLSDFGVTPILDGIKSTLEVVDKDVTDLILDDVGNYSEKYVNDFSQAIGYDLSCARNRFIWGSGNFHRARLDGKLELAKVLAGSIVDKEIKSDETILLEGHSHAGQLFALLTNLLANNQLGNDLLTHLEAKPHPYITITEIQNYLETIRTVKLDFVTFGTPVRYSWGGYTNFRLLPVINHRHNSDFSGLLTIRDGDYVQQWGVEGTDTVQIQEKDEENQLSTIIGDQGDDIAAFLASYRNNQRRQPKLISPSINAGQIFENVYVDYKDNLNAFNPLNPLYSVENVFGHGVYTTKKAMLYNLSLIRERLYS